MYLVLFLCIRCACERSEPPGCAPDTGVVPLVLRAALDRGCSFCGACYVESVNRIFSVGGRDNV